MKATLGALAALFIFTGVTLANSVPVRTRSAYGQADSLIVDQASTTTNGVTIASQEFCSDAESDPTTGACRLGFAFQITSTLPANATSLALTLPVPSNSVLSSAGLLTNDDTVQSNVFFSPFSQNDVLGLPDSAILFGTDGSGNPFFTFALPFPLNGHGTGLSVFMDVFSNSVSGFYCFPAVIGCTSGDAPPSLPNVGVDLATNSVPEPTSFSLLASGLLGLGFLRRNRQNS